MHLSGDLSRSILRSTTDGLWIFDEVGRTVYANGRLAEILGRSDEEMSRLCVADALDEPGREQLQDHLTALANGADAAENAECSFLRPDGTRIWVLVSHSPLLDDDGTARGWLHRVTELTDRRLLLDRVLTSEQQLAEAQAIANVGSWEWDVPADLVTWSDQLFRMYDLPPQSFEPTFERFLSFVHPEDRALVDAALTDALRGADVFDFKARIVRHSGEEAWIHGNGLLVRNEAGEPSRLSGTAHDITATVRAAQALKAASDRLAVLQAMTSAANETSSLGEAVVVAVRELSAYTGWLPRQAWSTGPDGSSLSMQLESSTPTTWTTLGPTGVRALAEAGVAWSDEVTPDGTPVGVIAIPVLVGSQVRCVVELITAVGLQPDPEILETIHQVAGQLARVAEREHSARELAAARDDALAASRMKSDFLATMSHEIRTPLNGVIGLSELLLRTDLSPRQRQLSHGVEQAGRTLLGLINDVLDLSKIEAGKLEIETVDFQVREVLEQAVALIAEPARANGVELLVHCSGDVPENLRGDPVRFGQIVTNLLSNAVKFTTDGEVVVRATLEARQGPRTTLKVEVSDSGVGIAPADQERLFEAFAQADSSTTRRFGGTGLGLSISKRLAEALGGEIGVVSEVGAGSTFWFTAGFEETVARPYPDDAAAAAKLAGLRVLVVDDNPTNRMITSEQLALWDVSSSGASSAREAMTELRRAARAGEPFEAVLVDMCMPDINGLELAELVRADPLVAHAHLLMLTSVTEVDELVLARLGIDTCLIKPVLPSTLLGSLLRLVGEPDRAARHLRGSETLPTGRGRVLVAEDNPLNQLVAQGMLESLGYEVEIVQDGVEAVEAVRTGSGFVAVLMDCQMPRLDGYAATGKIRAEEADELRVPIIAMTAAAIAGERERCLASGMDDFLVKPVDRDLLDQTLDRWLSGPTPNQAAPGDRTVTSSLVLDLARMRMLQGLTPGDASMFHRFVDSFLDSAPKDVTGVRAAVTSDDADALVQAAHRLRGSALNLGVPRVALTSGDLEELGERADLGAAAAVVDQLAREVDRALEALRRVRAEGLAADLERATPA